MASSLLALLDDISALLDDVSVLTKVAAKKTAGVLGDDLALNAQQVSGVRADRELPVVWAVAKGSMVNKAILVPVAVGISALAHRFLHTRAEDEQHHRELAQAVASQDVDICQIEKDKIRGAVRTDFVLSA